MMMVAPFVSVGMQQWCSSDIINCTFMFANPSALVCMAVSSVLDNREPVAFLAAAESDSSHCSERRACIDVKT